MSPDSVCLLLDIAERVRCIGKPFIIGGDFNATPQELQEAGIFEFLPCSVWAPQGGTCAPACRVIDFSLVSNHLVPTHVQTEPSIPMSPHTAVSMDMKSGLSRPWMRVMPVPRPFPAVRPSGCASVDFNEIREQIRQGMPTGSGALGNCPKDGR
eukprot:4368675-Pyramimonas_sp.AAC.1